MQYMTYFDSLLKFGNHTIQNYIISPTRTLNSLLDEVFVILAEIEYNLNNLIRDSFKDPDVAFKTAVREFLDF